MRLWSLCCGPKSFYKPRSFLLTSPGLNGYPGDEHGISINAVLHRAHHSTLTHQPLYHRVLCGTLRIEWHSLMALRQICKENSENKHL